MVTLAGWWANMMEERKAREVAEEECGLLSEQKRDGKRTKGRNKQVKYRGGGVTATQRRGVDDDSERAQRRGC